MNKGILQLDLSGRVPLELDYREPDGRENRGPRAEAAAIERPHDSDTQLQIADAFAWLLHVI